MKNRPSICRALGGISNLGNLTVGMKYCARCEIFGWCDIPLCLSSLSPSLRLPLSFPFVSLPHLACPLLPLPWQCLPHHLLRLPRCCLGVTRQQFSWLPHKRARGPSQKLPLIKDQKRVIRPWSALPVVAFRRLKRRNSARVIIRKGVRNSAPSSVPGKCFYKTLWINEWKNQKCASLS